MKITDKITITNEDNMQMMARYSDGFFDLAIVDLEYCIGASKPTLKNTKIKQKNGTFLNVKQTKHKPKEWDFKLSDEKYFHELFRISKKQIIFGGNYYGLKGGYLVWDKLNGETDQFGCEMAWLSFSKRTDIIYFLWSGMFQGQHCGKNIHKALIQQGNKSLNEKRIHPTQKPVKIYKYLLSNYAKPTYKIVDTHHGSGSLAEACFDYDFDLVACEKDTDIFNDCIKRIKSVTSQKKLFS